MRAGEEKNVVGHLVSINKMQQQRPSDAKDELKFFFQTIRMTFLIPSSYIISKLNDILYYYSHRQFRLNILINKRILTILLNHLEENEILDLLIIDSVTL